MGDAVIAVHSINHSNFVVKGLRFHACWWAGFCYPKTSSVSSKANTTDSRTERKKETKSKSRAERSKKISRRVTHYGMS